MTLKTLITAKDGKHKKLHCKEQSVNWLYHYQYFKITSLSNFKTHTCVFINKKSYNLIVYTKLAFIP